MRRRHWSGVTLVGILLSGAALPGVAHALTACTAADISAQDPSCPTGNGACTISKTFDVGNGCVLAFGFRNVTLTGRLNFPGRSITLRAGTLTLAGGSRLDGVADAPTPNDKGGTILVQTIGPTVVQTSGAGFARIDVSARGVGGNVTIIAGGVTIDGKVDSKALDDLGSGGTVDIRSSGDVTVVQNSDVSVAGGTLSGAGSIFFTATGKVQLDQLIDAHGGEGGEIGIAAGTTVVVRDLDARANGDAGSAGSIDISGNSVQLLGTVIADGSGSSIGSGGGDGGFISIDAERGDITVTKNLTAIGAGPDGGGGSIEAFAAGSMVVQPDATVSAATTGTEGDGGEISIETGYDFTSSGILSVTGGFDGGDVEVLVGRHATFNRKVDASGFNPGAYGGDIFIEAGEAGAGNLGVNDVLDVRGGICSIEKGCGAGGSIDITGCNVTVAAAAALRAGGPIGGTNDLTAREQLQIFGPVDSLRTDPASSQGTNSIFHRIGKTPTVTAAVTPPAETHPLPTCTSAGQTACIRACPVCGNRVVEFPETCDDGPNPRSCDGCSAFCQVETCNDGNGCTTDSCDPVYGCGHGLVADGTACSDGNVCNGSETCRSGTCGGGTPLVCNDNNPCTANGCNPTSGCFFTPTPGASCSDGNTCTVGDTCNGAGACQPGGPLDCSDSSECTTDGCANGTGCFHTPRTGSCTDDGLTCTTDVCSGGACTHPPRANGTGCEEDGLACTDDVCTGGACTHPAKTNGATCEDGAYCTVGDTCQSGACTAGATRDCGDSSSCTTDSCDEAADTCRHTPTPGASCSDGNTCTLGDTCDDAGACQPGSPMDCADASECTTDGCTNGTGCFHTPRTGACSDDGLSCTDDVCAGGACTHPPKADGATCEDGAYCTVNDTCQGGSCTSGPARDCSDSSPCTTDTCDEARDMCVHEDTGSGCCGNGSPDTGEECDDGNQDNTDGCLDTCVAASCGDGFVHTGVEECDLGSANSDAPGAQCRTDCRPRRCGDGVVDDQDDEQCDDGNSIAGDGCSPRCFIEPPPTASLIGGKGNVRTDCALEWAYDRAALDKKGLPSTKQTCRDGDPSCDLGTVAGECLVPLWVCANNQDPNLVACTPGPSGVGNVSAVERLKPSTTDATKRPEDAVNRAELGDGTDLATLGGPGACGRRMLIRVPLKSPTKGAAKKLKLRGLTTAGIKDSDNLSIRCTP